jgi:hypothetical protein
VAIALVPLPTKRLKALRVLAPEPPFATGRVPVTLVVKSMVPFRMSALTIWPL